MKFDMNIKTKLTVSIGVLVAMIVLLVSLSVTNLQILTATEPDSPAAEPGMNRALTWIMIIGGICICIGLWILFKIPNSINSPFKSLVKGILEIANHNYDAKLDLRGDKELEEVSKNFNRMAKRLKDYHNSTISDLMASKRYLETIINSINEPIVGLDNEQIILFINNEALNILNLKREDVIRKSAQEIAMRNDLLRRLICGMWEDKKKEQEAPKSKRESLKIYADNKESYFQVKYMEITMRGNDGVTMEKRGDVIMLKNVTEFQELDTAKTTFISTVSHELKTPISAIMMSLQLLEDKRVGGLNPEQEELSRSIKENSERLLSITGELLNMTQVESGKLQLKPKITKPIELIDYAIKANRVQAGENREALCRQRENSLGVDQPVEQCRPLFVRGRSCGHRGTPTGRQPYCHVCTRFRKGHRPALPRKYFRALFPCAGYESAGNRIGFVHFPGLCRSPRRNTYGRQRIGKG